MRLVRLSINGYEGLGLLNADGSVRGDIVGPDIPSMANTLTFDSEELTSLHRTIKDKSVLMPGTYSLLTPIANPEKVICVGLNYHDHTKESGYQQPDYPTIFPRFASSLIPHGAPIIRPLASDSLDFEGELVAVIGKAGRHINRANALSHVFGYSIFNDGSVREYQFKSPQWTVGKNFDDTGAFGPCLVTADELPDGAKGLKLETRLNGKTVQLANTLDMIFSIADIIAIMSEAVTLRPGDVIVAGTPAGIGWAREPKLLMQHGDRCDVEIEGIGVLSNPVFDEESQSQAVA